jgi:putative peptide zinc metalloprotease protein
MASALVLLVVFPWQRSIALPAFLGAESVTRVYAAADGQIAAVHVADAASVAGGQALMDIDTPDLAYQLSDSERDVEALRWQLSSQGLDSKLLDRSMVTAAELSTSLSKRDGLRDRIQKAQPLAPFAGTVVDLPDNLHAGDWVGEGTYLVSVAALHPEDLVAYADESQLHRIPAEGRGRLYLKGHDGAVAVRIAVIETGALRELDQPFMASNHGGEIAVREAAEGKLVPVRAIYRIRFKFDGDMAPIRHVSLGSVRLEAAPESFLQAAWRRVVGVIRRELSF